MNREKQKIQMAKSKHIRQTYEHLDNQQASQNGKGIYESNSKENQIFRDSEVIIISQLESSENSSISKSFQLNRVSSYNSKQSSYNSKQRPLENREGRILRHKSSCKYTFNSYPEYFQKTNKHHYHSNVPNQASALKNDQLKNKKKDVIEKIINFRCKSFKISAKNNQGSLQESIQLNSKERISQKISNLCHIAVKNICEDVNEINQLNQFNSLIQKTKFPTLMMSQSSMEDLDEQKAERNKIKQYSSNRIYHQVRKQYRGLQLALVEAKEENANFNQIKGVNFKKREGSKEKKGAKLMFNIRQVGAKQKYSKASDDRVQGW